MTAALLEFQNVAFHYGDRPVLENLSLTIQTGDCTALIGPNGAGKTTLLRLASGAIQPSSGRILLNGEPLAAIPRRQRSRLIALVPQQLTIPFDFTVQQVVEQGRSPYLGFLHGPRHADRLAVDQALDLTDLTQLRHRVFNELSGGERQRVKIALGLAQSPQLLLLDEPTQNLDIGRQSELIDLLHHLRVTGLTLFSSIHDLHLIPGNFPKVQLLSPAHPPRTGTPEEILTPTNLSQAFRCQPGRHPLLQATLHLDPLQQKPSS